MKTCAVLFSMKNLSRNMSLSKKPNLAALKWAHGVNSQRALTDALNNGNINMIEADIVLGQKQMSCLLPASKAAAVPIMAHPPIAISDITLVEFLQRILTYNNARSKQKIGIKLDFKSIEVFEGSMHILKQLLPLMHYPIWLNADIISGPVNNTETLPVDAKRFFFGCAAFDKNIVLSIGWTTQWSDNYNEGIYSTKDIENMLTVLKQNAFHIMGQPITFPVRAGIAANSINQLHYLLTTLQDTNATTLTIWSSPNDYVNVAKLQELIEHIGVERIYVDVPKELELKLNLSQRD